MASSSNDSASIAAAVSNTAPVLVHACLRENSNVTLFFALVSTHTLHDHCALSLTHACRHAHVHVCTYRFTPSLSLCVCTRSFVARIYLLLPPHHDMHDRFDCRLSDVPPLFTFHRYCVIHSSKQPASNKRSAFTPSCCLSKASTAFLRGCLGFNRCVPSTLASTASDPLLARALTTLQQLYKS
jgi:hypothetical protein